MKTLSIITPCFNEEKNIKPFYERLSKILKKINIEYKVFFIDDGSSDFNMGMYSIFKKKRS